MTCVQTLLFFFFAKPPGHRLDANDVFLNARPIHARLVRDERKAKRKGRNQKKRQLQFFCVCARMKTAKHSMMKHIPISCPSQFPSDKCLTNKEGKKEKGRLAERERHTFHSSETPMAFFFSFFFLFLQRSHQQSNHGRTSPKEPRRLEIKRSRHQFIREAAGKGTPQLLKAELGHFGP